MTERNEINTVISEETKNISNALLQLGQAYYEKHAFDFEPEFEPIIASIKESEEKIASVCMQTQTEELVKEETVPEYDDTVPEEIAPDSVEIPAPAPVTEIFETPTVVESVEEVPAIAIEEIAEEVPVIPVAEVAPEIPQSPAVEEFIPVEAIPMEEPAPAPALECCQKCGAVFEENAAFCNTCGAPKNAPAPVNDGLIMCPSCKEMIRPGTNFCTLCGSLMPSAMPQNAPVAPAPPVVEVAAPVAPAPSVEETIYTPAEETVAAPAINACPSCGAPIIQAGPFCTSCGSKLS